MRESVSEKKWQKVKVAMGENDKERKWQWEKVSARKSGRK